MNSERKAASGGPSRPRAYGARLHVVTFGCQMSAADGEELSRPLLDRGLTLVGEPDDADAIILNTCTVRQHAEDRALSFLGRLRDWKEARPDGFLIVAGCAAERLGAWIQRRFPHVDLVVGAKSIEQYPRLLEEALARRFDWAAENRDAWPGAVEERASAYLTIMRGCNYSCSYCIVPAVRGRELYRPFEVVLEEAKRLAASGARELMLLGQTVNSYRNEGKDFADLIRAVAEVPGLSRIRFMSPHPYYLGPRLIAAMAETPQVCPHLHLPVQSGADRVLKAMRRNYTAGEFLRRVADLRERVPGLAVSTDFIAGFPGETDEEFRATLELAKALDPIFAYCFKFSPREGTEAASLEGALPDEVKEGRLRVLLQDVEAMQRRHLAAQVGRKVCVLLENETDGRTEHYFHARLDEPGKPGTIVEAVVTGATNLGLRVKTAKRRTARGGPPSAAFPGSAI